MTYSTLSNRLRTYTTTPIVSVLAALTLTACGGGGGGSSDSGAQTPSMTEDTISISVAENTELVRAVSGTIESITQTRGQQFAVSAQSSGNALTIAVGAIDAINADARFEVVTSQNIRYIVSVVAENTSAIDLIAEAQALAGTTAQTVVADDLRLANVALELEYLAQQISNAEKLATRSANNDAISIASSGLDTEIATIEQIINGNTGTETQLLAAIDRARLEIETVSAAGGAVLDDVRVTLNNLLDSDLPADIDTTVSIEYVGEAQRYSRFMNDTFGTLAGDGSFTFSADYDFLNSVFPFADDAI